MKKKWKDNNKIYLKKKKNQEYRNTFKKNN